MHKRNDTFNPKDEMRTPPSLFKKLDDRFGFDIDAACTRDNCLCKCGIFKGEEDALSVSWSWYSQKPIVAFLNPPYNRIDLLRFIRKSYEESLKGAIVVILLPVDFSARWWDYCMLATEWIRIKGRIHFNGIDNKPIKGSPFFSSVVVVFDEQSRQALTAEEIPLPFISEMDWK